MTLERGDVVDASVRARFARPRGQLRLLLGVLLGLVAAALNQGALYAVDANLCAPGAPHVPGALHLVALLCLVLATGAGWAAYRDWDALGRGDDDERATVDARSRFLSLLGMGISALSALVILAQWAAVFVFGPCMRA